MTREQLLKNLKVPTGKIDVVLDTDAYNEIDDQFAICYMLASNERFNVKAIYAAPFLNGRSENAADGMEKSYCELLRISEITGVPINAFHGSKAFLKNEKDYEDSAAARDLVSRAEGYTAENPLYVVAIGAITNIASALLINPDISEKIVVVWLGGHSREWQDTKEFNMNEDYAAARVVMSSGVPFIQAPCFGVVSDFIISKTELDKYFCCSGKVSAYLVKTVLDEVASYTDVNGDWTRVVWDVVAVGWLLNNDNKFMTYDIVNVKLPTYDGIYSGSEEDIPMVYINKVKTENLLNDLSDKIKMLG